MDYKVRANIDELREIVDELKEFYPKLSDYELLEIAVKFQQTRLLAAAFVISPKDLYPSALEAIAIQDPALIQLRLTLLREEVTELEEAYQAKDIVAVLDALCDIQVVLNGAIAEAGLTNVFQQAMDEVCDSNDSKFMPDGSALLREGDNKILKGPNYTPPDLIKILRRNYRTCTTDGETYTGFQELLGISPVTEK